MYDLRLNFCFSVLCLNRTWFRLLFCYYNFATICSILYITFTLEANVNVGTGKERQDAFSIQISSSMSRGPRLKGSSVASGRAETV